MNLTLNKIITLTAAVLIMAAIQSVSYLDNNNAMAETELDLNALCSNVASNKISESEAQDILDNQSGYEIQVNELCE